MKIAFVTDNEQTISAHFGRAALYVVLTVEDGRVVGRDTREKQRHEHGAHHGHGHDQPIMPEESHSHEHQHGGRMAHSHEHSGHDHAGMVAPLADVDVLIARGMGRPAYDAVREGGIEVILTDVASIDDAAQAYIDGTLENRSERLH